MFSSLNVKDFDILKPVLERILSEIHLLSDCESVSIRLHDDGDYPYFVYEDFPEFFIRKEDSLHVRDEDGKIIRDTAGTPEVDCMCGNILKGRFNPTFSFFTEKGSFWTNSSTSLLTTMTEEERQAVGETRNTCHHFGYESVALIPISVNGNNIGLIQLNDSRETMFTLNKITQYELIADHVGVIINNILKAKERVSYILHLTSEFKKGEE